jgi:hypothetical protein
MHCRPADELVQSTHAPPLAPQADDEAPPTHAPAPLQQPPWQGCAPLHAVVHRCTPLSHAIPVGQSPAVLQPHTPPRQAWPWVEVVQSTHTPGPPHALAEVPA